MQTFLPYPSFTKSARVLDARRLGKQRVEALQILNTLHGHRLGWRTHPAVCMWRGYEDALALYGLVVSREWQRRGHNDTCFDKIGSFLPAGWRRPRRRPPWLGAPRFHLAHQAALLRKDPAFYGPLFPDTDPTLEMVWPPGPDEREARAVYRRERCRSCGAEIEHPTVGGREAWPCPRCQPREQQAPA